MIVHSGSIRSFLAQFTRKQECSAKKNPLSLSN
jgi:hypothetical protein